MNKILYILLLSLTSCAQYGFIEYTSPSEVYINQGGDIRIMHDPIYKDSLQDGDFIKFRCHKIFKDAN